MRRKTRTSPKAVGNDAEKLIDYMAREAGLQWETEKVVDNARRRVSGSVDRVYTLPDGRKHYIEIKHSKDGRYTYKALSEKHDISWSQIGILLKAEREGHKAGFIFVMPDRTPVYVAISDFMRHYTDSAYNHIKFADAERVGLQVDNMEWVNE